MLKEEVWGFCYNGLGDLWATTNYLLQLPREPIAYSNHNPHNIHTITTIHSLLDTDKVLRPVSVPPTQLIDIGHCFKSAYLPTKEKWGGPNSTTISYQLDGKSDGHLKNLSPNEEARLLAFLSDLGYTAVNVGGGRPLPLVVHTMAASAAFIGVPSGMSHIANSIGGLPNIVIFTDRLVQAGAIPGYIKCVYGNKTNMVFYHGVESLLNHPSFLEDFKNNSRQLIRLPDPHDHDLLATPRTEPYLGDSRDDRACRELM